MSNQNIYNKLSKDKFKKILDDIMKPASKRKFVIRTGKKGHEMLETAMHQEVLRMHLGLLFDCFGVTEEERQTLLEMINSPDPESMELAGMIINTKQKQWNLNSQQKITSTKL